MDCGVPLGFYDPEEAELILRNVDGDIKRVLTEVFVKQNYTMYVATAFTFDFVAINWNYQENKVMIC